MKNKTVLGFAAALLAAGLAMPVLADGNNDRYGDDDKRTGYSENRADDRSVNERDHDRETRKDHDRDHDSDNRKTSSNYDRSRDHDGDEYRAGKIRFESALAERREHTASSM